MLSVLLALATLYGAAPSHAQSTADVRKVTDVFALPSALSSGLATAPASRAPWTLELSPLATPVRLSDLTDGVHCVKIALEGERADYLLGGERFRPQRFGRPVDCLSPWTENAPLAFRLYAAVSATERERIGANGEFRLVMGWAEGAARARSVVGLRELSWRLEAKGQGGRWHEVALTGPGRSAGHARWVDDPAEPSLPALVLADTGVLTSAAATGSAPSRGRRQRAATLPPEALEFSTASHDDPRELRVGRAAGDAVPVIAWQSGQSVDRLRLRVLAELSEPSSGRYCVQAVYDQGGRAERLGRDADGRFTTAATVSDEGATTCASERELSFPVHVAGIFPRDAEGRFFIDADAGGATLRLDRADIALHAGGVRQASWGADADGSIVERGGWFADADGHPALLLRGSTALNPDTLIDEAPLEPAGDAESLATDSPASPLSPTESAPGEDPGDAGTASAAIAPAERDELVFAPEVTYGGYSRPLTSCLGRLVGEGFVSEPFTLRLGQQVIDVGTLEAIAAEQPVRVRFDRARDGGDCPVEGLETPELTLEELRSRVADGRIALEVAVAEPVFVGYLQLNAALYDSSLARWKNAIEFFDRVYRDGRAGGRWADGVLFGAGERGGIVPSVEPEANFVTRLGDDGRLRAVARTQKDNRRAASLFFDEQLEALAELFGEQPLELLYYDDLAPDCAGYEADVARSTLRTTRVVVVAGIDGYTANDGPLRSLPGNMAHVCVESDALVVYAFNWRERAANEDFQPMLATVFEDLGENSGSVQ